MIPRVEEAVYLRDYMIRVRFSDGTTGEVDLRHDLYGDIFEPLKNLSFFRQFTVNSEIHTITWPNGADFAPEFLYERAQGSA